MQNRIVKLPGIQKRSLKLQKLRQGSVGKKQLVVKSIRHLQTSNIEQLVILSRRICFHATNLGSIDPIYKLTHFFQPAIHGILIAPTFSIFWVFVTGRIRLPCSLVPSFFLFAIPRQSLLNISISGFIPLEE